MNDLFLMKVGVSNPQEAMSNSLRAALQRNKTYADATSTTEREALRHAWEALIIKAANKYSRPQTDAAHCCTIAEIADSLSQRFTRILVGGRLRFGTSQKAFNLYLKFLWRLGRLPKPPHCPVDGEVLRAAGLYGSWTKCDSEKEYMRWIDDIRKLTTQTTLADWEYQLWNQLQGPVKRIGR